MRTIDEHSAEAYLRETGRIADDERVAIRFLSGGVSNVVLYVERQDGDDFVLKQAREQLRVADPWFCSVERIWREIDVLRVCERIVGQSPVVCAGLVACTPRLLFEDRENFLYAMSAAPPSHAVWKQRLLAGETRSEIAAACGRLMGMLHAVSWGDATVAESLGDRRFFDDLRVDPYFRKVAAVHPDLRPRIERLCESVLGPAFALVHGDFSPKNLLLFDDRLMLIDFEVGHYGDPAFDLGFFLTHLVLKTIWAGAERDRYLALTESFWKTYRESLAGLDAAAVRDLERRAVLNFAGCVLARVDGKSKVDYLSSEQQAIARELGRQLLLDEPATWHEVVRGITARLPNAPRLS